MFDSMLRRSGWIGAVLVIPGCAGPSTPPPRPAPAPEVERVASVVDGRSLSLETLAARALEAAGGVVLEEAALDELLAANLSAEGITLPADATASERAKLFARIADEAGVAEEQAGSLVDRFRAARGLGPRRFDALLTRNAALRLLVQRGGLVDASRVSALVEAEFMGRARARIIVTRTAADAAKTRGDISAAPAGERSSRFAGAAYAMSVDPSSARGGVFGPVSHGDPSIPAAVRPSLSLPPGELSPVIALDDGFAIVLVEEQLEAAARTEASEAKARAKATARVEREAMDALAARLLAEARITVMDEHLRWAWERRPR
jgi:hypothetical protein